MKNIHHKAAILGAAAILLTACGADADTTLDTTEATDTTVVADDATDEVVEGDVAMDAAVEILSPTDGETVATSFELTFGVTGLTLVAAGDPVEGEGHLHLMVDVPCVAAGEVVVEDDNHLHLGDGASTMTLDLEAGEHTLCLQFADGVHTATDFTDMITVTVA